MFAQLDKGGRARLLDDLLHFDMVDLRKLPQTQSVERQQNPIARARHGVVGELPGARRDHER